MRRVCVRKAWVMSIENEEREVAVKEALELRIDFKKALKES
jgi:hypothetical protein